MIRGFWNWFLESIRHPHNLPHHLTAVFTFALAIFACYAWIESRSATRALEGQLAAIRADQRPFVWLMKNDIPRYDDAASQVAWDWIYVNIGKSAAYDVTFTDYIKVGNEHYQKSRHIGVNSDEVGAILQSTIPPGVPHYHTTLSRSGIDKNWFESLLKTNRSIGMLVEFEYFDSGHTNHFTGAICLERLSTGGIDDRPPDQCKK